MPFGLEELLDLVDLTEGGFDIGQLGGLVDEGFDIGQLGGDVVSQLTEFDADPEALAGLQRLIDSGSSEEFPDAVSRALAATARGGTTSLLNGFASGLLSPANAGGFRIPEIRLEETPKPPAIPTLSPPGDVAKVDYPAPPAPELFKPLAVESPAPRPEVGLERLLAQQRGAGEYLPESQRRLFMGQQRGVR